MDVELLLKLVMDLSIKVTEVQAGLENIKDGGDAEHLESSIRTLEADIRFVRFKLAGFGQDIKAHLKGDAESRSRFKERVFSGFENIGQRIDGVAREVAALKGQRDSVETGFKWFMKASAAAVFLGGIILTYAWFTIETNREQLIAQNVRIHKVEALISQSQK